MKCSCTHNHFCLIAQDLCLREDELYKTWQLSDYHINVYNLYEGAAKMRRSHRIAALKIQEVSDEHDG